MNERGWINNSILVTIALVLVIIALVVFLIMNLDVNVKG